MTDEVRVIAQDYHRNGVGGAGFVVSLVDWQEPFRGGETPTPHFIAVSFDAYDDTGMTPHDKAEAFRVQTAVLSIDQLMIADIDNAWRGADRVGPAVVQAWRDRCRNSTSYQYDPFDDEWKAEE